MTDTTTPPGPTVHDLEARYREIAAAPYVFTWAGRQWTLPHMRGLDYRLQAEIETYDEIGLAELRSLFARIFGPVQAADWEQVEVPADFLILLFEEWITYSGAQQGESPASSSSSPSTGTRSRRTSDASTTSGSPRRSTGTRAAKKAVSRPVKSST